MTEALTPRELELATISQLLNRESLNEAQSEAFFAAVARGDIDPIVLASVLTALKLKGETALEIAGAARAFRAAATPLPATDLPVIDCCGTGGDGSNTINISTTAAIVAAAMGLKVAKHGNRSVSSQSGSADLLEQLGIDIQMNPQTAARALQQAGVSFLFAPVYHSGIRHAMTVRTALKTRTLFNLLGPLLNPAAPKFQLLGVYDKALCPVLAEALLQLGVERAWVVHGEGCDEIALHGVTNVCEVRDGQIRQFRLTAADFGLTLVPLEALRGGKPADNAQASRDILSGKAPQAHRDAIAANVAAMLKICGRGEDLAANTQAVLDLLATDQAMTTLQQFREASHGN
ncbi:MAG: anthranilate phosphoribosyltransferase [Rheinheimera sp.]|nr:MAG: anthranilate phosphoribosyltransferase [Rheinheimera sp.]